MCIFLSTFAWTFKTGVVEFHCHFNFIVMYIHKGYASQTMSNEFSLQLLPKLKSSFCKEMAGCYVELIYNDIFFNICIEEFTALLQFCLLKTCSNLCQGVVVSFSVFTLSDVLMA